MNKPLRQPDGEEDSRLLGVVGGESTQVCGDARIVRAGSHQAHRNNRVCRGLDVLFPAALGISTHDMKKGKGGRLVKSGLRGEDSNQIVRELRKGVDNRALPRV